MKQQYIHASSYVRTWSCYNPNDLQQQCQLKVVYDNLKKKNQWSWTWLTHLEKILVFISTNGHPISEQDLII